MSLTKLKACADNILIGIISDGDWDNISLSMSLVIQFSACLSREWTRVNRIQVENNKQIVAKSYKKNRSEIRK